jgi:hypothetical protein
MKLDIVEDVLLGQGGDAEARTGHAPVCPIGRKMSSNLSLNAGLERFDLLEKSAMSITPPRAFMVAGRTTMGNPP